MASRVSGFADIHGENVLRDAGKKLSPLPSSSPELLDVLAHSARILSCVDQMPSKSSKDAIHLLGKTLIRKKMVRHHDMDVKILVLCCNCEILRLMAPNAPYSDQQLKGFFDLATKIFGKLSCAHGERYTRLTSALTIFRKTKLPVLMLDLEIDNLIVQLFKQFLTNAVSKVPDVVHDMEVIMTNIIQECDEPMAEVVHLLLMSVRKDNESNWELVEKVLKNCAGLLKPCLLDIINEMGIHLEDYSEIVAHICNSVSEKEDMGPSDKQDDASKLRMDTGHKRKLDCIDGNSNSVKKTLSVSGDPITPSESKTEELPRQDSSESCIVCVGGYKVKNNIAPILEAIFVKHGDIADKCQFKTPSVRVFFLEIVCEVVTQVQTNDDKYIICKMEEIESKVSEAEAANINVSWLRSHLEAFRKRKEAMEKSTLLMEVKAKSSMVRKAAKMDLKERREVLMAAQQQFEKADRCVKVLDLVDKKLDNNIMDSKTEQDLWARQSVL